MPIYDEIAQLPPNPRYTLLVDLLTAMNRTGAVTFVPSEDGRGLMALIPDSGLAAVMRGRWMKDIQVVDLAFYQHDRASDTLDGPIAVLSSQMRSCGHSILRLWDEARAPLSVIDSILGRLGVHEEDESLKDLMERVKHERDADTGADADTDTDTDTGDDAPEEL